jgi:hypothetical protein
MGSLRRDTVSISFRAGKFDQVNWNAITGLIAVPDNVRKRTVRGCTSQLCRYDSANQVEAGI